MRTLVVTLLLICSSANAGLFDSGPPADFLQLVVTSPYVKEFPVSAYYERGFKGEFTKSWVKAGDGKWIMVMKAHDAMSGKDTLIKVLFAKQGANAQITQVMIDGEYAAENMVQAFRDSSAQRLNGLKE